MAPSETAAAGVAERLAEIPGLRWLKESETVDLAVADVTPGWHRAYSP